jgi:predicted NUDIX family NTP pyrophosphohydrolase
MWRRNASALEVFLVHPGGPFYRGKDAGVWSLPKGEVEPGEDAYAVAGREFHEETGRTLAQCAHHDDAVPLGELRLKSGKTVIAWALEGAWPDGVAVRSNTFTLEWPPRSGRIQEFPEVDDGAFLPLPAARTRIHPGMAAFLDRLVAHLDPESSADESLRSARRSSPPSDRRRP